MTDGYDVLNFRLINMFKHQLGTNFGGLVSIDQESDCFAGERLLSNRVGCQNTMGSHWLPRSESNLFPEKILTQPCLAQTTDRYGIQKVNGCQSRFYFGDRTKNFVTGGA